MILWKDDDEKPWKISVFAARKYEYHLEIENTKLKLAHLITFLGLNINKN